MIGTETRDAFYNVTESTDTVAVFRYTLVAEDFGQDSFALASSIDLNGGTIKDLMGNNAIIKGTWIYFI